MSEEAGGSTPTPDPAPSSASGQQNQGQRQNNNDRNNNDSRRKPTFKGMVDELRSNVFVCPQEDPDKTQDYRKIMEAIEAYMYRELTDPEDMICVLKGEKPKKLVTPELLDMKGLGEGEKIVREEEIKDGVKRDRAIHNNVCKAYNILWNQCTEAMQAELKGDASYNSNSAAFDCVWLVKSIKSIMMSFVQGESRYVSMLEAKTQLLAYKQLGKSNDTYFKEFTLRAEIIMQHDGTIGGDEGLIKQELVNMGGLTKPVKPVEADSTDIKQYGSKLDKYITRLEQYYAEVKSRRKKATKIAREKTLAVLFLTNSDKKRYNNMVVRYKQSYVCGRDEYPHTLNEAMRHLAREEALIPTLSNSGNNSNRNRRRGGGRFSHQMVQVSNRDPRDYELIFNQQGIEKSGSDIFPSHYIICDSGSTHHGFKSRDLLVDVCEADEPLFSVSNGGWREVTKQGTFRGIEDVWYDPGSLANILSLGLLDEQFRVQFDNALFDGFKVHREEGVIWQFKKFANGLYFYDTANGTKTELANYSLFNTVANLEKQYTKKEVAKAKLARNLQIRLGRPSQQRFEVIIKNNQLKNCPITIEDARRALKLYGIDPAFIKGTTVRGKGQVAGDHKIMHLPKEIYPKHKDVCLCFDFFFVNRIPFIHSISTKINFRTTKHVEDRKNETILKEVMNVIKLYENRGFRVTEIRGDGEFKGLEGVVSPRKLTIVPKDAHVPEVERSNRTVKNSLRTVTHGLPFRRIPKLMVLEMVFFCIKNLNLYPAANGISTTLSPLSIVRGEGPPDYNHLGLEFGSYAQVFNDNPISNSMAARTTDAIALCPSFSSTGGQYFLNLETGQRIFRRRARSLPMPHSVIEQVEYLGKKEGQPRLKNKTLLFERRPGVPIDDDTLHDEADTLLLFGDDDDDDDFDIPAMEEDVSLAADDDVSDAEITDLADDTNITETMPAPTNTPTIDPSHTDRLSDFVAAADASGAFAEQIAEASSTLSVADDVAVEGNATASAASAASHHPDDSDWDLSYDATVDAPPNLTPTEDENKNEDESSFEATTDEEDEDYQPGETEAVDTTPAAEEEIHQEEQKDEISHTYGLRDRSKLSKPSFKEDFDNPPNTKSYGKKGSFLQVTRNDDKLDSASMHRQLVGMLLAQFGDEAPEKRVRATGFKAFALNQMSAREGIKLFGQRAVDAMLKEFAQLDDRAVFRGVMASSLTEKQKKGALSAINLIKHKRDNEVKGRTVANGKKHRHLYSKEQSTSPTISHDAMMISLVIDAIEGRDVAIADIAGAYLFADMDEYILLRLTGQSVDLLCKVNKEYEKYVTYENGVKVLYLELAKALYGCVRSALLWYELFTKTLKGMGFVLNGYDPCVANKIINGSQCTVGFWVDDNKISHKDERVVTEVIKQLESHFGKMKVSRGREHTFLGMKIKFNDNKTMSIDMKDYCKEAIASFPGKLRKSSTSPSKKQLFTVDDTSPSLDKERAEVFHSIVMKLAYVAKRCRVDLETTLGFLRTRVSKSTEEDWEKLRRALEFLCGTIDDVLTLGADGLAMLLSFVDVSFGTHHDMKSHTGGASTFGRGVIMTKSTKQKLNTRSTTESEIVGVSDYLPDLIWLLRFLEEQGYKVTKTVLMQDNEGAIKLEKHGRKSSSRRTRHMDMRYFFIKDRLESEGIEVKYCPTEAMIADYFTKPLQGALFNKLRRVIMGMDHISVLKDIDTTGGATQERVALPFMRKDMRAEAPDGVRSYADVLKGVQ